LGKKSTNSWRVARITPVIMLSGAISRLAKVLDELHSVHPFKAIVGEDDRETLLLEDIQRFFRARHLSDLLRAESGQQLGKDRKHLGVVVDHENRGNRCHVLYAFVSSHRPDKSGSGNRREQWRCQQLPDRRC